LLFDTAICRALIGLALAGLVVVSPVSPAFAAESLAVVVSPDVEVDELSFADFRKIMLGDRQFWKSGKRITLIVRGPDSPERELLLEKVYKMNETQFRRYWIAKVFRAEVPSQPRIVVSNDEAVDLIGVMEGGITVVNATDVPEGLKVLKIGGRSPGDAGYLEK
jgi:ABC-type phosphate transport system substrate-binding protein